MSLFSRTRGWTRRALPLVSLLALAACTPFELNVSSGSNGSAAAPLSFFLPSTGSVIGTARVLSVSGDGVDQAVFELDGEAIFTDESSPFEWTLEPAHFPAGSHTVGIAARQNGVRRSVSSRVTLEAVAGEPAPVPPAPAPVPPAPPAPPAPPPAPTVQFVTPANGATVSAPTVLTVTGDGVTAARFHVDGAEKSYDTSAPFQWTLDPAAIPAGSRTILIHGIYSGGMATHSVTLTIVAPAPDPAVPSDVLTAIQTLQPGQWYEIPNSKLRPFAPNPQPTGDFRSVINAWCSGAYDTKRDQYIVWGGGHGDYSGNEIYAFSMKTFTWKRLTEPSAFPPGDPNNSGDKGAHPDNAPISRHSYDMIDYLPGADRFICAGGFGIWRSGQFNDFNTYLFDFDTKVWSIKAKVPCYGSNTAVGPDGRLWMQGDYGANTALTAYDPKTDTWTKYAPWGGWLNPYKTSEIDPVNNKFVMVGNQECRIWDLNNPLAAGVRAATTGATEIQNVNYPGVSYDPVAKKIFAWGSGSTVYNLDVPTLVWSSRQTTGRNTTPPKATYNGTNGRIRYVPSLKVFVVINHVDENVFVFRNS